MNDIAVAVDEDLGTWHRLYRGLRSLNNLLLIPMFTLMVVDASAREFETFLDAELINTGFCVFFLAEWALGLILSPDRRGYLKNFNNIIDLVSAIPFGHVFQSARLARLLRLFRLLRIMMRAKRLRGRSAQLLRAAGLLGSTALAGALAIRTVEPNGVRTLGDAMWWALTTLSTVGYGDVVPTTSEGRIVGVGLFVCGIGVFGYVTGVTTALLQDPDEDETLRRLERIEQCLLELRATMPGHRSPPKESKP